MLRTKGEAGTGNVVEAVRHGRTVQREIKMVSGARAWEDFGLERRKRRTHTNTVEKYPTPEDCRTERERDSFVGEWIRLAVVFTPVVWCG